MNRRQFVKMAPAFPAAAVAASLVLSEEGKDPVSLDVSVLKCEPGDTLVLRSEHPVSPEAAERIKAYVSDMFDGRIKALVLSPEMKLEGVIRA